MLQKILIVSAAAFFLTLAIVSVANANGGPHGGYSTTTDACAGCHRAHTAPAPYLLTADEDNLCLACHGSSASGATTNVNDGIWETGSANVPLIAGGFSFYKGQGVTSKHNVGEGVTAAWGYTGTYTSTTLLGRGVLGTIASQLECSSCHNPHGSTNYRILNTSTNGITVTVAQVDEAPGTKNYNQEQWGPDMSNACDGCHRAYHVFGGGTYKDPNVALSGGYAHTTQQFSTRSAAKRQQLNSTGWSTGDGITVVLPMADLYATTSPS